MLLIVHVLLRWSIDGPEYGLCYYYMVEISKGFLYDSKCEGGDKFQKFLFLPNQSKGFEDSTHSTTPRFRDKKSWVGNSWVSVNVNGNSNFLTKTNGFMW